MNDDLMLLSAVVGAVCALAGWLFGPLRHAVTAVHEAGHTLVALLAGRSVRSVRLNRDSSGEAVSVGRQGGLGVVLTLLAGYPAPGIVGLGGLVALRADQARIWLVAGAVVVALMALLLRNAFGVVVIACVGALLVATLRWASDPVTNVVVASASWFLLVGGLRSALELFRPHVGRDDAMELARVGHVPAFVWRFVFLLAAIACLTAAAVVVGVLEPVRSSLARLGGA